MEKYNLEKEIEKLRKTNGRFSEYQKDIIIKAMGLAFEEGTMLAVEDEGLRIIAKLSNN